MDCQQNDITENEEETKGNKIRKGRAPKKPPKPEKPPKQVKVKEAMTVTITKGEIIVYFDEWRFFSHGLIYAQKETAGEI